MEIKVRFFVFLVLVLSCMSSVANAGSCSWSLSGLTVNPYTFSFECMDNETATLAATKVVTVSPTSAPSCSVSVSSGYVNNGSCSVPRIDPVSPCSGSLPKWSTALLCDAGMSYSDAFERASSNCQSCSAHTVGPCSGGAVWVCD